MIIYHYNNYLYNGQETPRHIVPASLIEDISVAFNQHESAMDHRTICGLLQRLADQSEANWQKSQFSAHSVK